MPTAVNAIKCFFYYNFHSTKDMTSNMFAIFGTAHLLSSSRETRADTTLKHFNLFSYAAPLCAVLSSINAFVFFHSHHYAACWLVLIGYLLDLADGAVARQLNACSALGEWEGALESGLRPVALLWSRKKVGLKQRQTRLHPCPTSRLHIWNNF